MAKVHITNVLIHDNPSNYVDPFKLELFFECIEPLSEDLEWALIYVGSAESESYDQVLDTIYVGPVPEGRHSFIFETNPPNPAKIPDQDVAGVTVILLTCCYRKQEFVRVGYFVNNFYTEPELIENPPVKPIIEKLARNIMDKKPRVTRFKINWEDPQKPLAPQFFHGVGDMDVEEGAMVPSAISARTPSEAALYNFDEAMEKRLRNDSQMDDEDSLALPQINGVKAMQKPKPTMDDDDTDYSNPYGIL